METTNVKIVKIFLSSYTELKEDRVSFANLINRLQTHYLSRGFALQIEKWEYLDPANNNRREQDEYIDIIKHCDVFVFLFRSIVGKFVLEELNYALKEKHKRKLPVFIYFRDLKGERESEELKELKRRLSIEQDYFWGHYDTNDKLHLDFVLWLDNYLNSNSHIYIENGKVAVGDVTVADMDQVPFAANNDVYKRMHKEIDDNHEIIEELRKKTNQYPDEHGLNDKLQQALEHHNSLIEEFERYQLALVDTAKLITDRQQEKTGVKFKGAIDAFESGDLQGANSILSDITKDAEKHLIQYLDHDRELVHQYIDALQLQSKTVLADVNTPIEKRVIRVLELYTKADDWASRSAYDSEKYAQLLSDYASFLNNYAHYDEAIRVYMRQIALSEELYGKDSAETTTSYSNIGLVYKRQSNYDKALEYFFKALNIRAKVLGTEHPEVATSYNNIGSIYYDQGESNKALEYFFKALDIRKKALDKENPAIAVSYNNIGLVYQIQGNYNMALDYYFRALKIDEKVLGTEHPDTAQSYNNIGSIYNELSEYTNALEYYFKALSIYERVLGTNHPDTATSYNNISSVYNEQREYDKALEYSLKALDIYEKVLGTEHPHTAMSYNNIGYVYHHRGEYDKALEYYFKALTIYEKVLGTNHPFSVESYNNIGSIYESRGDHKKALEYFNKALNKNKSSQDVNQYTEKKIDKKSKDGDAIFQNELDNSTQESDAIYHRNIGLVHESQGNYSYALICYSKALDIREKEVGKKHSLTATSYSDLGSVYEKMKDYKKALKYHHKALKIRQKNLGTTHPITASSLYNIGLVFLSTGEFIKALDYFRKVLQISENELGDNHPYTISIRESIDYVQRKIHQEWQKTNKQTLRNSLWNRFFQKFRKK